MAYRLTALARNDLKEIADYIGERNPAAAEQLLDEFLERIEKLAAMPTIGTRRDEIRPGLRFSVVRRYGISYRITGINIDILRVIHGARDIESQWLE